MDCNYRSMGICRFVGVAVANYKRPFKPYSNTRTSICRKFAWSQVVPIVAQMIGAMLGAFLVWPHKDHLQQPKMKLEN
jgi:hypothetical protein